MNQIHHVTQPVRLKVMLMFQNCSVPYYYQNGSKLGGITFLVVSVLSLCGVKKFYFRKTNTPTASILARGYDTVDLCAIIAKFNCIPMESCDAKNGSG